MSDKLKTMYPYLQEKEQQRLKDHKTGINDIFNVNSIETNNQNLRLSLQDHDLDNIEAVEEDDELDPSQIDGIDVQSLSAITSSINNMSKEQAENDAKEQFSFIEKIKHKKTLEMKGKFMAHDNYFYYSENSLWVMNTQSGLRKVLVWLVTSIWFERFILVVIVLNAVSLSLFDYTDKDMNGPLNKKLDLCNKIFTIIFIVEAVLKIMAMGFILHPYAYMRDYWNAMDIIIVITGVIDFLNLGINLKALRILRVLRPLRSVKAVPSMRRQVTTLLKSLPGLGNATILLTFMMVLFTIMGLQNFTGIFYQRCRTTLTPLNSTYWPKSQEFTRICSPNGQGVYGCPANLTCGSPLDYGISLKDDGMLDDEMIQFGINSFQNFGASFVSVFQTITGENWSPIMYNLMDGSSPSFSQLYFCVIIMVGHLYMLQLLLAVIMTSLGKIQSDQEYEDIKHKEDLVQNDKKEKLLMVKRQKEDNDILRLKRKSSAMSPQKQKPTDGLIVALHKKNVADEEERTLKVPDTLQIPPLTEGGPQYRDSVGSYIEANLDWDLEYNPDIKGNKRAEKLHILSKLIGLQEMEDKFNSTMSKIKKTRLIEDLEMRLKVQQKLKFDVVRQTHIIDLIVSKMYTTNKKTVYGIENELQLIEQIHKSMKLVLKGKSQARSQITEEDVDTLFQQQLQTYSRQSSATSLDDNEGQGSTDKNIDLNMTISLKLALNLKELSTKYKEKESFDSRFKRHLLQKKSLDRLESKLKKLIEQTEIIKRNQNNKVYTLCNKIIQSKVFKITSYIVILINAIILGWSKYPSDQNTEVMIRYLNIGSFVFFVVELIVRLIAAGFKLFLKDKFNWFDATVVIVSGIDIFLQYSLQSQQSGSGAITALRVLRLIRLFQLAKISKSFQELLKGIQKTLADIINICLLLGIFVFTYILIGMQLFAFIGQQKFTNTLNYPSPTFNSFFEAFLSVFIVLANEGWSQIYFSYYRQAEPVSTSIYFFSLLIIGQFILLNLFIAILIENFEQLSVLNDLSHQFENMKKVSLWKQFQQLISKNKILPLDKAAYKIQQDKLYTVDLHNQLQPSLYLFKFNSLIRKAAKKMVLHNRFDQIMTVIIIISTFELAIDSPLSDNNTPFQYILTAIDKSLTSVFVFESCAKIISYGFIWCGSKSYLRSGWNVLDFFVILITILSYVMTSGNLNAIKAVRLIKIFRLLRIVSKNQSLKVALTALGLAVKAISNIIAISMVLYFIFGVIGVNYFKGRFYDCQINSSVDFSSLTDKWNCINMGGEWVNNFFNFDNSGNAMSTIFMLTNMASWSEYMYIAASNNGIDQVHSSNEIVSPFACVFFVLLIIIGNFFISNLFVGVIITTCNREKEVLGKHFFLTEDQQKWVKNKNRILKSNPKFRMLLPKNDWRQPFFHIAQSKTLEYFILACIIANTVILTLSWYDQPALMTKYFDNINLFFAIVFTFEFIIKFVGYGYRYFQDSWNVFDCTIVAITLLSMILSQMTTFQMGAQSTIIRSFKIARVLYFIKRNKALRSLIQVFLLSLPAMVNIGGLLLLIILIYAILGVNLFAEVKLNGALTYNSNFQTFGSSFVMLIRVMTGENWPLIMQAVARQNDVQFSCNTSPSFQDYANNGFQTVGCGSQVFSFVYFFSFILLVCMIFLKLFAGIILQSFHESTDKQSKFMNTDMTDHFRDCWSQYDPNATQFINQLNYPNLLMSLGEPLGWDHSYKHNFPKQQEYMTKVNLQKYNRNKEFNFGDILEQLIIMILIRREIINFGIKTHHFELLTPGHSEINKHVMKIIYQQPLTETHKLLQEINDSPRLISKKKKPSKSQSSNSLRIMNQLNQLALPIPLDMVTINESTANDQQQKEDDGPNYEISSMRNEQHNNIVFDSNRESTRQQMVSPLKNSSLQNAVNSGHHMYNQYNENQMQAVNQIDQKESNDNERGVYRLSSIAISSIQPPDRMQIEDDTISDEEKHFQEELALVENAHGNDLALVEEELGNISH